MRRLRRQPPVLSPPPAAARQTHGEWVMGNPLKESGLRVAVVPLIAQYKGAIGDRNPGF